MSKVPIFASFDFAEILMLTASILVIAAIAFVSEVSSLRTIVAWTAKATMLLAVAGCSLAPQRETSSPVAWESRTPRSVIETAFASLNAAPTDAEVVRPKAQGSCNELESLVSKSALFKDAQEARVGAASSSCHVHSWSN